MTSWMTEATDRVAQGLFEEMVSSRLRVPWPELDEPSKLSWRTFAVTLLNRLDDLAPTFRVEFPVAGADGVIEYRWATKWLTDKDDDAS